MKEIDRKIKSDIEKQEMLSNLEVELSKCLDERKTVVQKCKDALSIVLNKLDSDIANLITTNLSNNGFELSGDKIINAEHSCGISYVININSETKFISKSIKGANVKGFKISYKNNLGNIDATESSNVIGNGTNPIIDSFQKKIDIVKQEIEQINVLANDIKSITIKFYGKGDEEKNDVEYKSLEKLVAAAL